MDLTTGRGFSMIELLAVLALAGILAGLALPGWNRLLPSQHLASSVRVVQSELQAIKMRAAAENAGYRFVYEANAPDYAIEKNGNPIATKALPEGVSITKAGAISFSPRGTANGNRVRLESRDGSCQQVVVSPTGRVRACKPSACASDC
jgi:prepilin-type N-terminal cleavage/methylation domain-containing protein